MGKYMIRPLLCLEHLSFDEQEGKVGYRNGKKAGEMERTDRLMAAEASTEYPSWFSLCLGGEVCRICYALERPGGVVARQAHSPAFLDISSSQVLYFLHGWMGKSRGRGSLGQRSAIRNYYICRSRREEQSDATILRWRIASVASLSRNDIATQPLKPESQHPHFFLLFHSRLG